MMAANPLEHIVQHPLVTRPLDLAKIRPGLGFLTPRHEITLLSNHIAMLMLTGLLLMLFVPVFVRRRRAPAPHPGAAGAGDQSDQTGEGGQTGAADEIAALVPAGPANAVEAICLYLREQVVAPTLQQHTDRFIKFIWTLFFFVLVNNLIGLVPLATVTPLAGLHIGGTATGNIWVTGTLAVMTLVLTIWNGVRLAGWHFFAHFCPGPLWLAPLLVPIEILGLFAKGFALAIRLFANMLAGHMMLAVLLGFILGAGSAMGAGIGFAVAVPVVAGSVAVTFIEILVAVIQAFIFTFLTSLFIGQAVVVHEEGEAHAH